MNISHCRFTGCTNSDSSGGGLSLSVFQVDLVLHDVLFDDCYSYSRGGGFCGYSLESITIDFSRFTRCGSLTFGQTFYADLCHNSGGHSLESSIFINNGDSEAPMATDNFASFHGTQTFHRINISNNQGIQGGSAAFLIAPSSTFKMSEMMIVNNSCAIGRTLYFRPAVPGSEFIDSNVLQNGAGSLGIITFAKSNFTVINVALADNERHSHWFYGQGTAWATLVNCHVKLTAREFRVRAQNVDLNGSTIVFGAIGRTITIPDIAMNDSMFAGMEVLNGSVKRPVKVDVFNAMRVDDAPFEKDVTLFNETVVCLLFPIFLLGCYLWLRTLYLPRPERGELLIPVRGRALDTAEMIAS
jgi:hypothetical protein